MRDQLQKSLGDAYRLERELGGGGMSRVFLAEELRLERKVVVKVLSPDLAQGLSAERFEREIRTVAALQQANIVPVLTAGETDGLPFYTMPFVEGESLRAHLGRGPLAITEVVGIVKDVSKALAYAHQRGVVHRDIKPDNVLLSGGTAVVTDFGIAKAISAARTSAPDATLTQVGTSIGTPAYMAPEQAAGDANIDHRADIYALGAMTYELLSGRQVFPDRTAQRMLAAHMGEAPQPIAELRGDVPAPLAELVMQCLAKDPNERPQSAGDIVRVLETITSGSGTPVMPAVLLGRSAHVPQSARDLCRCVRRRGRRREGGDRRHRPAGMGISGLAHRDGARVSRRALDRVRAARDAPRAHRDADVHAGRNAVDDTRHHRDDRAQGGAARELVSHGARRAVRVRRVHRGHRGVHGAARARHRAVRIAARGGTA